MSAATVTGGSARRSSTSPAASLIAQKLGVLAMQVRGVRVLTASGEDLTSTDNPAKIMMRQIAAEHERALMRSA